METNFKTIEQLLVKLTEEVNYFRNKVKDLEKEAQYWRNRAGVYYGRE